MNFNMHGRILMNNNMHTHTHVILYIYKEQKANPMSNMTLYGILSEVMHIMTSNLL